MTRPSDLIRTKIITEVLPNYLPAMIWDESAAPFTSLDNSIFLSRQAGQSADEDIRELIVECWLFSKTNASNANVSALFDDATAAMSHLLTDYTAGGIFGISVIEDVTGPFQTGQNRKFYRFTVRTLVNS